MGTRENKVEKYLHDRIEKLGGTTYKWVSPGRNGVPDRIVILHGMVWFVEVKTVDGRRSGEQKRELARLQNHGCETSILYGHGAVDTFVSGLLQVAAERGLLKR